MRLCHEVRGRGAPVVLIAGLSQIGATWGPVVDGLSDYFQVVTVDNRETGGTGASGAPFTLADCATDVLETLTALGHEHFGVVGTSMGGMIAQEVVRLAPERARGAVFMSTAGGTTGLVPGDASALLPPVGFAMEGAGTDDRVNIVRARSPLLCGPGFADAHPEIIDAQARLTAARPTPVEGILRQLQAISMFDPGDALVGTATRALVAHGTADPLVPFENGRRLAERLGAPLAAFENAGHLLHIERTAAVVELLCDHLTAPRSTGGSAIGKER